MNESPSDKLNTIYFHLFEHFANENGRNNNNLSDKTTTAQVAERDAGRDWNKWAAWLIDIVSFSCSGFN